MIAAALVLLGLLQEAVVIRTLESPSALSFPAVQIGEGEIGIALGVGPETADLVAAAGFSPPPFVRGKVAIIADPKAESRADLVVWVTSLPREQAAAVLREAKGISLCIVSGRGGGDPEPLKIGEAWMVQAPGAGGLWGRVEFRAGSVSNRFSAPDGKPSEKVAELRKKRGLAVDPLGELREKARPAGLPAPAGLEMANRACRVRIHSVSERNSYGSAVPSAGRRLLILDAELENTIPLTLVQSNQVPTQYRINEVGDHLYLVVNGSRVSRLLPDGSQLPGHVATSPLTLDRLGARSRGNLVFEVPAEGVGALDLRFYDYAHGHMALTLRAGAPAAQKPLAPLQQNEVLEGGVFRADRVRELAGKKAPEGMTFLVVEFRARSRMVTESDATAFDPKAKPGEKIGVGTVSDWTDVRKHLHILVDGDAAYGSAEPLEFGEAPRFIPDVPTGGTAAFLIPEKARSVELRCDFPNARLPDGQVVHPKALAFLLEGKRPEPAAGAAIVEIDDEVFKVAVTRQSVASEFAGVKAPDGSAFLVLDVTVTGAGTAGEQFQAEEQLLYATEKGAQLAMHESAFRGSRPPAKLVLVPNGERRSFQAVFAIPESDRKPRLAYRGVSKAVIVALKPLELPRACPKCRTGAAPAEKFCGECGTKIDP